jgi:NADPH2:quinone reductase
VTPTMKAVLTMKAWRVAQHGAPADVLQLADVPVPQPGPGMVSIRGRAAALNIPDDRLCRGTYQMKPELPFTPGMETAGVVEAVGADVDPELVGRHVVAVAGPPFGSLAEVAVARATGLYDVPADLTDTDAAAMLIPFTTGHLALHRRGRLQPGETLLVHAGAGGVGSAAIQMGVMAGARVIATAGGPEKVELCRQLGADLAIDYRALDSKELIAAIKDATGGRGVEVCYDSVGGEIFHVSRRVMAREGRLLVIGFASGDIAEAPTNHALMRSYDIVGVYFGSYAGPEDKGYREQMWTDILAGFRNGQLTPVLDRIVPLTGDVPGALTDLAERRTAGRVIIDLTS